MAFDNLPQRPPVYFPGANAYIQEALARSKAASERDDIRYVADLPYGTDPNQKLDVYTSWSGTRLPVLVFVHGGAWSGGYKEMMGFMAPAILATPAVFVSPGYRLVPQNAYPAPVKDMAATIRWVYENIAQFGGDPKRIFIGGHSAGAHLISLVALDPQWLAEQELTPAVIKGALPVSAPLDLRYPVDDPRFEVLLRIRRAFVPNDGDAAVASPLTHANAEAPAFYVADGAREEFGTFADDAGMLTQALAQLGVPVALDIFPGHDHFAASSRIVDEGHPWIARARKFLRSGSPNG